MHAALNNKMIRKPSLGQYMKERGNVLIRSIIPVY